MKQDISNEIEKIISYCKSKECDECKYRANDDLCNLHNPTAWNVNQMNEIEAIKELKSLSPSESAIETVLNLIEKQQAEIEKYKMLLSEANVQFLNSNLETKRKNEEDLEMLYEGCQEELEKKDKIIDYMAEYIERHSSFNAEMYGAKAEEWKEYFNQKIEKGE